jgi:putative transposase
LTCATASVNLLDMARLARVVVPGLPHHVTQRGNGRSRTFFEEADCALYRDLLREHCGGAGVEIWAWVLMPNHVHLVLNPCDPDGLRNALSKVHRRYAGRIHARQKRTGHFWQGRFGAVAMDEAHLAAALRYVAMNPVRARLVSRAQDWRWSSVHAHLSGRADRVTLLRPTLDRFPHFADLLDDPAPDDLLAGLRRSETIGRPLGDAHFIARLEAAAGRRLRPLPRGPKPKDGEPTEGELSALSP